MPRVSPRRAIRALLPCTLVVVVFSACSATTEEPDGLAASPPETRSPATDAAAASDSEAADLAEIETVFAAYWDAVIESENGPVSDPAIFDGIATGGAVEMQLTNVNNLINDGIRRIGAPALSEPVIHLAGDTARVEVCVDISDWGAAVGDHTAPPQPSDPSPRVVDMERIEGAWLVTDQIDPSEATITC